MRLPDPAHPGGVGPEEGIHLPDLRDEMPRLKGDPPARGGPSPGEPVFPRTGPQDCPGRGREDAGAAAGTEEPSGFHIAATGSMTGGEADGDVHQEAEGIGSCVSQHRRNKRGEVGEHADPPWAPLFDVPDLPALPPFPAFCGPGPEPSATTAIHTGENPRLRPHGHGVPAHGHILMERC